MPGYPRHHRHPKDLRKRDGTVRAVRLGGCLSTVVGFLAVVLLAAAGGWVVIRLLQAPIVEPVPFSPEDGVRAQQKIVGLVRRSTRAGSVEPATDACHTTASRAGGADRARTRDHPGDFVAFTYLSCRS